MSGAFREVLGLDEGTVGRTTSFFEAGGDSTLAVALIGKLRASVSDAISLRDLFEAPTVGGLSARLVQLSASEVVLSGQEALLPAREGRVKRSDGAFP